MRARHGKDVRRTIYKRGRERLAAKTTDVHAFLFADFHGVETGRLAAQRARQPRQLRYLSGSQAFGEKSLPRWDCGKCYLCRQKGRFSRFGRRERARFQPRVERARVNLPNVGAPTPRFYGETRSLFRQFPKDQSKEILSSGQLQPEFVPKIQNQNSAQDGND